MSTKKGLNQVVIGNFYDSEQYYAPNPTQKKGGVMRYFFTGDDCSVSLHMIPAGTPAAPEHAHPHEQFLIVPQGDGVALVDGEEYDGEEGFFAYCPAGVPHGYDASQARQVCWNLDIFFPERLEYEQENFFRLLAQGKNPMAEPEACMITKDTEL
ncbi:MAG: cupin domain-containing protein [Oscillospiraceae bacterium]|nr:cupin domain-containing protein [Oscillospiraceae bacterium]